jgi:hypothetical protein
MTLCDRCITASNRHEPDQTELRGSGRDDRRDSVGDDLERPQARVGSVGNPAAIGGDLAQSV